MSCYYATANYPEADLVIRGVPYDRTSSFIPGSRFGPAYIRQSTDNVEDYSPYQDRSVLDLRICDGGDLVFQTRDHLTEIEQDAARIIEDGKTGVFLGGEHTVTYPLVKAAARRHDRLSVIHFDAHGDLRDTYRDEKISHATALRRVSEVVGMERIYQLGIRSGPREEFGMNQNLFRFAAYEPLKKVLTTIKDPLYVTIDVDVLDPGVMPCVATPEPGGISFRELLDSLLLLRGRKIVSADIVEYNPLTAAPYPSGSTVAVLLRELLLVIRQ